MRHGNGVMAVILFLGAGCATPSLSRRTDGEPVHHVLDAWHQAAAHSDEEGYFKLFAKEAVFLGTDGSERWTLPEFRAFAHPYFSQGKGWKFVPRSRHVAVSDDGATAWFDEALESTSYGDCRGSGVLRLEDGAWRIAQYNLSIPIPNALAKQVVQQIREPSKAPGTP